MRFAANIVFFKIKLCFKSLSNKLIGIIDYHSFNDFLTGIEAIAGKAVACDASIPYRHGSCLGCCISNTQLSTKGLGKAGEDGPSVWVLALTWGDPDHVPGSWL